LVTTHYKIENPEIWQTLANEGYVEMAKKKMIITGIGGPAGRAASKYLDMKGISFIGVDMDPNVAKQYPGRFFQVPAATDKGFVGSVIKIAKREGASVLLPAVDEEFIPIAKRIKSFRKAGIDVVISPLSTIRICRDKFLTAKTLQKKGIAVPRTLKLGCKPSSIERFGFPALTKPRSGRGGRGITVFDKSSQLLDMVKKFDDSFILQEFIGGKEYDVNLYVHKGKAVVNKVLFKTKLEHGNYGNASGTVPIRDKAVEELAARTAKAIGAEGPIDMDVRKDAEGRPVLLEINPRIGANVLKTPQVLDRLLKTAGLI
jgi:carbamoylphosphate synthase large subunit